jgi:hypothetical protein
MIWLLALTGWNIGATGNASELTLLLTAPRRGHRAEWEARCPLGEWAPREPTLCLSQTTGLSGYLQPSND